jgi:DNA-binding CsgD family transcriptional regulator
VEVLFDNLRSKTLIIHPREMTMAPAESSMQLAARIGAELALIDGTGNFGDVSQGVQAIERFVAGAHGPAASAVASSSGLSAREVDVLRLIAAGRSNAQIAETLVISPNTVGRHVSNIFDKIGATNRAEATAYAMRNGLA